MATASISGAVAWISAAGTERVTRLIRRLRRAGVAVDRLRARKLCALLIGLPALGAAAEERLPLWELGMGAAGLSLPAYPGSDQQRFFGAPFPYLIYRGDFLRSDEEGVRGRFFGSERLQLEVSGNGTPAVRSEDVPAREGMPDLDLSFELGPSLSMRWRSGAGDRWKASLSVRALMATDFPDVRYQGYIVNPELRWQRRVSPAVTIGARVGARFADGGYHDYFYGVDDAFARPSRSAFSASGGYNSALVGVFTELSPAPDWPLRLGVSYQSLDGAAFRDSPLVAQGYGLTVSLVVARVFLRSETTVPASRGMDSPRAPDPQRSDRERSP